MTLRRYGSIGRKGTVLRKSFNIICKIFPRKEGKEKRLFELLKKAYVDARYKKSYKITKPELEYLADRVKKLRRLALKKCREKIEQFEKESTT
jgi:uncharacterized protein (UPF0216 family)